jgi:two-component system, response regulator
MGKVGCADVLLIEDSLEDAELTIYALRGTCTHVTVDTFERSDEALSYLTDTGPHAGRLPQLIVLDFDMPGVDAHDALRRFKSHPETKSIPLIVLTTSRDPSLIRECYAGGANSVLCKARQLKDYFAQMQQLAKYWLQVNAGAAAEADTATELATSISPRSNAFNELHN